MIRKLLLLLTLITLVTVGFVSFQNTQNDAAIESFEDCIAAGYPMLESYPERCIVPNGPSFTRQINLEN